VPSHLNTVIDLSVIYVQNYEYNEVIKL